MFVFPSPDSVFPLKMITKSFLNVQLLELDLMNFSLFMSNLIQFGYLMIFEHCILSLLIWMDDFYGFALIL